MGDLRAVGKQTRDFLGDVRPMLIAGEWHRSGVELPSVNPADGLEIGRFSVGGLAEANAAVAAARRAFDTGVWRSLAPAKRADVLWRIADLIARDADTLAELETLDSGKLFGDARHGDVAIAAEAFRYHAGWCTKLEGRLLEVSNATPGEFHAYARREPIGVAALVVPWNGPLAMTAWKLAPALAAGCAVIIKPPEQASLSVLRFGELLVAAGIAAGVVNIVTGPGHIVGAALAAHPDVDKVSFTGSVETGRRIMHAATGNMKKLTLELGGKSPAIVFADADLDAAARGIAQGIYSNAGQVCVASSRVYVQSNVYDELLGRLVKLARQIRLGPGLDSTSEMGPLISAAHRANVTSLVDLSVAAGATAAAGGKACGGGGFFFEPTILVNLPADAPALIQEVFGPVLCATPFSHVDEAIALANGTEFGLAASVWTRDLGVAHRVASEVRAGLVWINNHGRPDVAVPFGGYRQSGWGREQGRDAIDDYAELKSVVAYLGEHRA